MKTLYLGIIVGIIIAITTIIPYEIIQTSVKTTKLGCTDPHQVDLQYDAKSLSTRQQVESIVLDYPATKKIIADSTYCEFMSVGTLYTPNGTYQGININLNNTKNLVVQISLRNNSVVSYELFNLTRDYTTTEANPFNFILPYVIIGAIVVGIFVVLILIRKNRK
ncbi:MAG: hypothetical protein KGH76_06755 [Thaumarchaeota archaeon]|nr:hypothetical protein [Nitrososphaerota archaeon]